MDNATKIDDITDALRERILSGDFGKSGRLPSQRMLAEEYNTSRETINKAIQRLQAEGLLISLGLQGVIVGAPRSRIPGNGETSRFASYIKDLGLDAVDAVIGMPKEIEASTDVAQFLNVPEGTQVIYVLRKQGTSTSDFRIIETFYPMSLIGNSILENMQTNRDFDVLSAIMLTYGKAINKVRDDIIGRFPTQHEQDLLKIVRSTPVLEVDSVHYAEDNTTVILYSRSVLVASYFVLSYEYKPV